MTSTAVGPVMMICNAADRCTVDCDAKEPHALGYGRARWVATTKQVFAITENRALLEGEVAIDRLRRFETLEAAVVWIVNMFRRRKYPTTREGFLRRLDTAGYSVTPGQSERVRGCLMRVGRHLKTCDSIRGGMTGGDTQMGEVLP